MEKIDPVAKSMTQTVQHDTTTTYQCHCQFPLDSPPVFTCGGASLHIQLNTDFFLRFILQKSKIIFPEKSLSVHMSVCLFVCPVLSRHVPPKKSLKQKILLNKVVRYTSRVTKKILRVMLQCWARRSRATYIRFENHTLEFHQPLRVGHLGSTREAGTF